MHPRNRRGGDFPAVSAELIGGLMLNRITKLKNRLETQKLLARQAKRIDKQAIYCSAGFMSRASIDAQFRYSLPEKCRLSAAINDRALAARREEPVTSSHCT